MSEPPAQFPPPVAKTIDWLKENWSWYYAHNPPPMPDRYTRREFGFMLWPDKPGPPPFFRHRAYSDRKRFTDYLAYKAPHSCYYSTAYYRRPAELKMADKGWLGAELIFDLDADHLDEAEAAKARGEEMPIEDQLRIVKDQFRRLLDEFIFGDFGVDPKDVFLTFSGGRGYHAHVMDPRMMALDNKARREIVDYITGKVPTAKGTDEPDLSPFIWEKALDVRGQGQWAKVRKAQYMHPVDAPGWQGRLTRSLVQILQTQVLDAPRDDAMAWLVHDVDGVGKKSAETFLDAFDAEKLDRIGKGYLEQGTVVKRVCKHVLAQSALALGKGETDEPVTADVKRLIRLPGSLHGKSGLRVVTLTRDELDDFDPFRDAVAFPMDPVKLVPRSDQSVTLAGERVAVKGGDETEVPMAHAVWMCARQQASLA